MRPEAGQKPGTPNPADGPEAQPAAFHALLEDSAEDLYDNAPCGYLSTLMNGQIAKINATLLTWLGYDRDHLVGRKRFAELLTAGGKLYHETHFAPLLQMQGELSGIALELKTRDGKRLPVLVSSTIKTSRTGQPLLIRTTVFDARDRRAYEQELLRSRRQAEQARARAEQLQLTAQQDRARLQSVLAVLQNSLLPPSLPEIAGLQSAAYYRTASPDQLGGDFYDLFPVGDGRWCFILGDVCGKGPQAATVTSLARYTLRAACLHDPDPESMLATLHTVLHDRYADDPRFCTIIVGFLARARGGTFEVTLASGGHPPALVLHAAGGADFLPTPGGTLVGILPQPHFSHASTTLRPGDLLLLYTDGLTEARTDPGGERYSGDALRDFAARLAPTTPRQAITALAHLLDGFDTGLQDDTAILALGNRGER